jgi:hypothetical protein
MSRWIRFLFAILVGIALGLLYGWVVNPVEYVDTTPDTLRIDYKTDYVLMVAEAHHGVEDLGLAIRRLALLGDVSPEELVRQAISFAEKAGYSDDDINLMRALAEDLQVYNPLLETISP